MVRAITYEDTKLADSSTPNKIFSGSNSSSFIDNFNKFAPFKFAQKVGEAATNSAYQATK